MQKYSQQYKYRLDSNILKKLILLFLETYVINRPSHSAAFGPNSHPYFITVPPAVTVHPQSKMRFAGDALTFCCDGVGNPTPEIEW